MHAIYAINLFITVRNEVSKANYFDRNLFITLHANVIMTTSLNNIDK